MMPVACANRRVWCSRGKAEEMVRGFLALNLDADTTYECKIGMRKRNRDIVQQGETLRRLACLLALAEGSEGIHVAIPG